MIFDTIFEFYYSLFEGSFSSLWQDVLVEFYSFTEDAYLSFSFADYISVICTVVTIICGIFALFRILGGVLRLFKV